MTSSEVKEAIKKMEAYNIEKLNDLSNKSGISLLVIGFWWDALKN